MEGIKQFLELFQMVAVSSAARYRKMGGCILVAVT